MSFVFLVFVFQGKQVIRPIAFKPIPYISGEPVNQRFSDLGDRYGSTPSLTPNLGNNLKFGSKIYQYCKIVNNIQGLSMIQ